MGRRYKPLGLPAPTPVRFYSRAERAAEQLPARMKTTAIPSQLERRGAPPAELEYANLDEFLRDMGTGQIPTAEVLRYLQQAGPLGQMQRFDQMYVPDVRGAGAAGRELAIGGTLVPAVHRDSDIRGTFDAGRAFPRTLHTAVSDTGNPSDYRESLFFDRGSVSSRASGIEPLDGGLTAMFGNRPLTGHDADMFLRYHRDPKRLIVHDMQSDVGQKATRDERLLRQIAKEHGIDIDDPSPQGFANARARLIALRDGRLPTWEIIDGQRVLRDPEGGDDASRIQDALEHHTRRRFGLSPMLQNDQWLDFLSRQMLGEAAYSGLPISLPSPKNAYKSGMGMPERAAAEFYGRHVPDRIRKLARGFDPEGGGSTTTHVPDIDLLKAPSFSLSIRAPRHYSAEMSPAVAYDDELASRIAAALEPHRQSLNRRYLVDNDLSLIQGHLPHAFTRQALDRANDALNRPLGTRTPYISEGGARALSALLGEIERTPALPDQRRAIKEANDARKARHGDRRGGVEIELTPAARRNIQERGIPIMRRQPSPLQSLTDPVQRGVA